MKRYFEWGVVSMALAVMLLVACGGGGGGGSSASQSVNVPVLVSDAASEDWATIGVKLLSLTLTKSDNTTVAVTLPSIPTALNLAQLDNLGEILSSVALNPGDAYTGATLTISANPGDVTLITSPDPEAGFPAAAGVQIASAVIQIQGAAGSSGNKVVSIPVTFATPLVVPTVAAAATGTPAVDLEVDLNHPTFIVAHVPPSAGTTIWSVNFNGPVRHKPAGDIRRLVLRHMYGTVASVSSDNTSLTFTKDMPHVPIVTPESGVPTNQSITVLADGTNGTLFYDIAAKTKSTIMDFSAASSVLSTGKFVRVAARYQQNGSLVATRIWVGPTFNSVWISPEGHVLHANTSGNTIVVSNELGQPVPLTINSSTQFFFRQPENALADVTAISTNGLAFLQAGNIVRGFKVHAQADVTTSPMTATTIDIETAVYQGKITSNASGVGFTKTFNTASDDYTVPASGVMSYINSASANGNDPLTGSTINGFKYWNFAYPTIVTSGASAVGDFVTATGGIVSFGSAANTFSAHGATYARWGDLADPTGWTVPWMVVEPTNTPKGTASALSAPSAGISTFTMAIPSGSQAVTVDVNSNSGQATLVYIVGRSGDVVTVTPLDITVAANLTTLTGDLAAGTAKVQVSAVPQANGHLKAYVLTVYTGTLPVN